MQAAQLEGPEAERRADQRSHGNKGRCGDNQDTGVESAGDEAYGRWCPRQAVAQIKRVQSLCFSAITSLFVACALTLRLKKTNENTNAQKESIH